MPDIAGNWTQIRIRRKTLARLRDLGARVRASYERGQLWRRLEEDSGLADCDSLSIDAIIQRLLNQHARHSERRKRQLGRRRKDSRSDAMGGDTRGQGGDGI